MNSLILKIRIRIILVILITVLFFALFKAFRQEKSGRLNNQLHIINKENTEIKKKAKRESITFILGDDREPDNPYYTEAKKYYLHNEDGKTEYVITHCRSLLEVRNYLETHPPVNALPWGLVNLVSHGNQWLGLSVKVTPESKRTTTQELNEAIVNKSLTELPDSILDQQSILYIHGCGVGNNPQLIHAIAKAFGGSTTFPKVKASKHFEYYSSRKNNVAMLESQRYFAETWYTIYKRGYKPDNKILCSKLNTKYPNCDINWHDALSRERPRWTGDIYYYTFEVPVKWVIKYSEHDTLPDLTNQHQQIEWILAQSEIMTTLKEIEIPVEDFNWWFREVQLKNEDGSRSPAIWLKGYSTILCIIKPIVKENLYDSQAYYKNISASKEKFSYYYARM